MMMNTTLEQLRGLRLNGMVAGLQEQMAATGTQAMSFEERMALLVERELHWRGDKKRERLLKEARLKYPQAAIEDLDTRAGRGIDRRAVTALVLGDWIESGHSILITGPTGAGKSWLACALAQYACRRGHSAIYQRVPRLGEELRIRHGNGTFGKWLLQLAKTDVLLLDQQTWLFGVNSGRWASRRAPSCDAGNCLRRRVLSSTENSSSTAETCSNPHLESEEASSEIFGPPAGEFALPRRYAHIQLESEIPPLWRECH